MLQKLYATQANKNMTLTGLCVSTCHEELVHCHIMHLPNPVHSVYRLILCLHPHNAILAVSTCAQ